MTPGSAHFNGSSQLSLASGLSVPNGQGLTIAFWAENTSAGGAPNIITQTANPSSTANNMWWYGLHAGLGVYRFVTYASDNTFASPGSTGFGTQNQWVSHVFVYDDSVLNAPAIKHYINNIASGSAGGMDLPMHNNPAACPLIVGNGDGDGFGNPAGGLIGNIDSLGIWNFAFSSAQAGEYWNAGAGLDFATLPADLQAGLYAWYNMDGPFPSGPNAGLWPDYTANKRHLSVTGTVTVGPPRNM